MELLEYLRETSRALAELADKDRFESLAYIFRMAALDADRCMTEPTTTCAVPPPTGQTATILPFRITHRR